MNEYQAQIFYEYQYNKAFDRCFKVNQLLSYSAMGSNISQQTTEHCTLGNCTLVYLAQFKGCFLQYYYIFENGKQLSKYTKKLQQATNTPLLNYSWQPIQIKADKSKCGQTIVAKLYFSSVMNNLANQIQMRKIQNKYFSEQQVSVCLGRLLTISLVGFNKRQKVLSISPKKIVFNSQKFLNFKVLSHFSLPEGQKSFQFIRRKLDYYPSPQQLLSQSMGHQTSDYDQHKSEIFSLGMLLLSICVLKDTKQFYSGGIQVKLNNENLNNETQIPKTSKDQKQQIKVKRPYGNKLKKSSLGKSSRNVQLDDQGLKLCLRKLQHNTQYSEGLLQVLKNMLEPSPTDRNNAQQLLLKLEQENIFKQQSCIATPIHKLGSKTANRNKQSIRKNQHISQNKLTGFYCGFGISGLQIVNSEILDQRQMREMINPKEEIFFERPMRSNRKRSAR